MCGARDWIRNRFNAWRPGPINWCSPIVRCGWTSKMPRQRRGYARSPRARERCGSSPSRAWTVPPAAGTHVSHTGEIGAILIRKLEKIRSDTRVEFVCGARAVARARADFAALSKIARQFSSPLDETPELVAAQLEQHANQKKSAASWRLSWPGCAAGTGIRKPSRMP